VNNLKASLTPSLPCAKAKPVLELGTSASLGQHSVLRCLSLRFKGRGSGWRWWGPSKAPVNQTVANESSLACCCPGEGELLDQRIAPALPAARPSPAARCAPGVPDPALLGFAHVGQNVGFLLYRHAGCRNARIRGQGSKKARRPVGLLGYRRPLPESFSGGMQKTAVSFARALNRRSSASRLWPHPLLLFDEPIRRPPIPWPARPHRGSDRHHQPHWRGACSVVVSPTLISNDPAASAQRVAMLYDGSLQVVRGH